MTCPTPNRRHECPFKGETSDLTETTEYFNKTLANMKKKPVIISRNNLRNIEREQTDKEDERIANIYAIAQNEKIENQPKCTKHCHDHQKITPKKALKYAEMDWLL